MKSFVVTGTLGIWLAICSAVTAGDASTSDRPTIEPAQPEVITSKSRSGLMTSRPTHLATTRIELSTPQNKRWESLPVDSRVPTRTARARVHARADSSGVSRTAVDKVVPTGACCNAFLAANECFSDWPATQCQDAGAAYIGDGTTCASVDCASRCDQEGQPCDYCWLDTPFDMACPESYEGDGDCDCGCQFDDSVDCAVGGDPPDLVIQSSTRSPATGVVPLGLVTLSDTVQNQGTGTAASSFWATWFISEDITVTTADYEWAFHEVPAGLAPGQTGAGFGDIAWPDEAPYNVPGQIYYIAVMADDLNDVAESNETNNWGGTFAVVLAGGDTGCPGTGLCCEENGTPGCQNTSCCELVCTAEPLCCNLGWVQACVDLAQDLCPELCSGHEACPGVGDCCSPNQTVGCEDPTCCNLVCAADVFCCGTEWDPTCAITAEDLCDICPGFDPDVYEPDDLPVNATNVDCDQVQTHTIPVNGDVDWFAITLDAGSAFAVETSNLDGANPDTVVELYDAACAYLTDDDDGGSEPFASRLEWIAAYSGVHLIKVRTFGGETGHCNDLFGGPKSCSYDVAFECSSCCDPPFQAGDRVRLLIDNPGDAPGLPAGVCGTVGCCNSGDPAVPILVSWDNWTDGHYETEFCDVSPAPFPETSGWWMSCDNMMVDETCGPCPPPPPPVNPMPLDQATQVPLDIELCWNGPGQVAKVIYGADDRLDVYEVSEPDLVVAAHSTAAVVARSWLTDNGNETYTLPGTPTLAQDILAGLGLPLCLSEPFATQPVPAYCSGFLVGEDLLVTAGHCVVNAFECSTTAFVFGFEMADASTPVLTYPASDVYFCSEIVDREQVASGPDWAVIRLDRPVVGHDPLPIRRTGSVSLGDSLVMIGHPVGLPTKVAGGATVRSNAAASYFQANVDAYGGNSGSAVLNATTLEVEGVLVRGNPDWVQSGGCIVSNQCSDSGCPTWESATRVTEFADLVPASVTREYDVWFEDADGMAIAITATTTENCLPLPTLDPNTRYVWQVSAKDACGATPGAVWSFTTVCGTSLASSAPAHEESLWRSENNIVRLTFDQNITAPVAGEILIRELLEGGVLGPDLSSSFAFAVENDNGGFPRVLMIREIGAVLSHRKWYGISSRSWGDVCDFGVHYPVQVGDASNDGRVLSYDVSVINAGVPELAAQDDERRDIDGDGQILSFDVNMTNGSIPSLSEKKPGGH